MSVGPFQLQINGGETYTWEPRTSIYCSAVAAVPAVFGVSDFPVVIRIWVPKLVEAGYGPYDYWIEEAGGAAISVNMWVVTLALVGAIRNFFAPRSIEEKHCRATGGGER